MINVSFHRKRRGSDRVWSSFQKASPVNVIAMTVSRTKPAAHAPMVKMKPALRRNPPIGSRRFWGRHEPVDLEQSHQLLELQPQVPDLDLPVVFPLDVLVLDQQGDTGAVTVDDLAGLHE